MSYTPKSITASVTLNSAYTECMNVINAAAGLTITLPAATGSGKEFLIYVGTTVTSSAAVIQVANSSDVMAGVCLTCQDAGDTVVGFETAVDSDTITMNGTTKGGVKGDKIVLTDVATNLWAVDMWSSATGTEVTPFSAAV